ncbi:hypothetical protein H0H81_006131 [Sphagnurus paluster]|uniref:Tetratricopeptide repeat protein n=1 Tax=Sphagnurus paluster TaxID=117069 RepID=A0A9P7GS26_9AGAR|nr:hypothetical protein H0H81_006131 [Sphagnurus paluster]
MSFDERWKNLRVNFSTKEKLAPAKETALREIIHDLRGRATAFRASSNYEASIHAYMRLIPLEDQIYTPDSPEAATSFNNLGEALIKQGDMAAAEEGVSTALRVREDVRFGGLGLGSRYDASVSRENMAKIKEGTGILSEI